MPDHSVSLYSFSKFRSECHRISLKEGTRLQSSVSIATPEKRCCRDFLRLFEFEFSEFGLLLLSFPRWAGGESSPIIRNDGLQRIPEVLSGVRDIAALAGEFDHQTISPAPRLISLVSERSHIGDQLPSAGW
jgi:hypothetical protein